MKKLYYLYGLLFCLQLYGESFAVPIQQINTVGQAEEVYRVRKPKVVEFYRPSCPHCQNMMPIYKTVAQESANGTQFYMVNCDDLDTANTIAKKVTGNESTRIGGVPTLVFINSNGTQKDTHIGGMTKSELNKTITQLQ